MNPTVVTNQKPKINTQKLESNTSIPLKKKKKKNQITMEEAKRSTEKNYKNNQNKRNKMAISTNTSKCQWNKCFNQKTQLRGGGGGWTGLKNKTHLYST